MAGALMSGSFFVGSLCLLSYNVFAATANAETSHVPWTEVIFEGDVSSLSGIAHANRALLHALSAVPQFAATCAPAAAAAAAAAASPKEPANYVCCETQHQVQQEPVTALRNLPPTIEVVEPPVACSHLGVVRTAFQQSQRAGEQVAGASQHMRVVAVDWAPGTNWHDVCSKPIAQNLPLPAPDLSFCAIDELITLYSNWTLLQPNVKQLGTRITVRSQTWLPTMVPGIVPFAAWGKRGRPLPTDLSRFVLHLPWEIDGFPLKWTAAINACVDEIWVPSDFVKKVFVRAGILAPSEIFVLPHAVAGTPSARVLDTARQLMLNNDTLAAIMVHEAWGIPPSHVPSSQSIGCMDHDTAGQGTFVDAYTEHSAVATRNFVFLFVGGLLPRKGVDILLDAVELLLFDRQESHEVPRIELWVYWSYSPMEGRGAEYAMSMRSRVALLQEKCKSQKENGQLVIRLLNSTGTSSMPPRAMAALFARADCLVLPYRAEGFALTVYDAALAGTPSLLPHAPGLPTTEWLPRGAFFNVTARRVPCADYWPCDTKHDVAGNSSNAIFRESWGGSTGHHGAYWHGVAPGDLAAEMNRVASLPKSEVGVVATLARTSIEANLHLRNITERLRVHLLAGEDSTSPGHNFSLPRRWRPENRNMCMGYAGMYYQLQTYARPVDTRVGIIYKNNSSGLEKQDSVAYARHGAVNGTDAPSQQVETAVPVPHQVPNELFENVWAFSESGALFRKVVDLFNTIAAKLEHARHDFLAPEFAGQSGPVPVALCSFPNSGTSWTLNLVRRATGIFKHTVYAKECANGQHRSENPVQCEWLTGVSLQNVRGTPRIDVVAINETFDRNGPGRFAAPQESVLIKTHLFHYTRGSDDWQADMVGQSESPGSLAHAQKVQQYLAQFAGAVHLLRNPIDNIVSRAFRAQKEQMNDRSMRSADFHTSALPVLSDARFRQELDRWVSWHLSIARAISCWPPTQTAFGYVPLRYHIAVYSDILEHPVNTTVGILQFLSHVAQYSTRNSNEQLNTFERLRRNFSWQAKYKAKRWKVPANDHARARNAPSDGAGPDCQQSPSYVIPMYLKHLTPWQIMHVGERLRELVLVLQSLVKDETQHCSGPGRSPFSWNWRWNSSAVSMRQTPQSMATFKFEMFTQLGFGVGPSFSHAAQSVRADPWWGGKHMIVHIPSACNPDDGDWLAAKLQQLLAILQKKSGNRSVHIYNTLDGSFSDRSRTTSLSQSAPWPPAGALANFSRRKSGGRATHFIVLCCAKAPRRALLKNIVQHPAVNAPQCVEPHFFDKLSLLFDLEREKIDFSLLQRDKMLADRVHQLYLATLTGVQEAGGSPWICRSGGNQSIVIGEATTNYVFSPGAAALAFNTLHRQLRANEPGFQARQLKLLSIVQDPAYVFAANWILPFQKHRKKLRDRLRRQHSQLNASESVSGTHGDSVIPPAVLAFEQKIRRPYSCGSAFRLQKSQLLRCVVSQLHLHSEPGTDGNFAERANRLLVKQGLRAPAVAQCVATEVFAGGGNELVSGIFLAPLLQWFQAALDLSLLGIVQEKKLEAWLSTFPEALRHPASYSASDGARQERKGAHPGSFGSGTLALHELFFFLQSHALFRAGKSHHSPNETFGLQRRDDPTNLQLMAEVSEFLELDPSKFTAMEWSSVNYDSPQLPPNLFFQQRRDDVDVIEAVRSSAAILDEVTALSGRVFKACNLDELHEFYLPFNNQLQEAVELVHGDVVGFMDRYWSDW